MDENNAIRAITIGVSTFIAIITISAVMMYYNTAKATVQEVGSGPDLYNNYASYIKDILVKPSGSTISGTEAINIINYFYNDDLVTVNIDKIKLIDGDSTVDEINKFNKKSDYSDIINKIIPIQNVEITVVDTGNERLTITLKGIN